MKNNPAAEHLIAKLIKVLSEEMQMYNELLLVLRKKQTSIIEGKLEDLQQAVIDEQAVLKKTEKMDQLRSQSMEEINKALNQDEDVRTLSQLIQLVESTYAERLSDLHVSLQKIVQEVLLTNEENRYLLDYSIRFVREAARELIKTSDQFPVYSASGKGQDTSVQSSLIEGKI